MSVDELEARAVQMRRLRNSVRWATGWALAVLALAVLWYCT